MTGKPSVTLEFETDDDKRRFLKMQSDAKKKNNSTLILVAIAAAAGFLFMQSDFSLDDLRYELADMLAGGSGGGYDEGY